MQHSAMTIRRIACLRAGNTGPAAPGCEGQRFSIVVSVRNLLTTKQPGGIQPPNPASQMPRVAPSSRRSIGKSSAPNAGGNVRTAPETSAFSSYPQSPWRKSLAAACGPKWESLIRHQGPDDPRIGWRPHRLIALPQRTLHKAECQLTCLTEWMRSPPVCVEPSMSSRPPLILVVEDDPNQQDLMLMTLQHIGVTEPIHFVSSGMAAIAYVEGEGPYVDRTRFPYPTLIITDLQMPACDGYEFLAHLRDHPSEPPCPVVVFSSLDDEEHIAQAKQLGASIYIGKSMSFAETCRALRALFPAVPSSVTTAPVDPRDFRGA
jgi:CheY-like chemotaxis protein